MKKGGNRMDQTMNTTIPMTNQNNAVIKHGGHEVLDVHSLLGSLIGLQEQYLMYRTHIQDQELLDILDRQKQFLADQYNIMVEAFSTGQDPSKPTGSYNMNQNNNVIYGMKPSQPKKPIQSINELNDECISSFMMGLVKANASTMTVAALEATNPVVRRVIADSIPNMIEMAYEIFLYQNKKGYYQVPPLPQMDMQQLLNGFAPAPMGKPPLQ